MPGGHKKKVVRPPTPAELRAVEQRLVADYLVRVWDIEMECPHQHLPLDDWPHDCDCFEASVNPTAEKLIETLERLIAVAEAWLEAHGREDPDADKQEEQSGG